MARALREVPDATYGRVTNCPPWTLAELVVHIAGSITMGEFADAPGDAELKEAADYYRRPERDTSAYREANVRRTQQATERMLANRMPADFFRATFDSMLAKLAATDQQRAVEVQGVGAMRLHDWLTTRVIALAAHGLDVAITCGRDPWTTTDALELMRPVFVSLLSTEPPSGWDDLRLLAVATGRAQLSATDRSELGRYADRFPLLS